MFATDLMLTVKFSYMAPNPPLPQGYYMMANILTACVWVCVLSVHVKIEYK